MPAIAFDSRVLGDLQHFRRGVRPKLRDDSVPKAEDDRNEFFSEIGLKLT